jgi:molybdopterin-biosynthesis enzyme MoeA-like protein
MAQVPEGTEVLDTQSFPVVRCRNVYIFPGVPRLFRGRFESISALFSGPIVASSALITRQGESELAPLLEEVLDLFSGLEIGSYPRWRASGWEVLIILEHDDETQLDLARSTLVERIDKDRLTEVHERYKTGEQPDLESGNV